MRLEDLFQELILEQNIGIINSNLETLAHSLGRNLTETEEDFILDIVDEYTPTGEDGYYVCPLIPFDYAWHIYQARQLKKLIY